MRSNGLHLQVYSDAHSKSPAHDALLNASHVYSAPQCLLPIHCYLYFTTFGTFLPILVSIWAGYVHKLKIAMSHKTKLASRCEVIWRDEGEGQ